MCAHMREPYCDCSSALGHGQSVTRGCGSDLEAQLRPHCHGGLERKPGRDFSRMQTLRGSPRGVGLRRGDWEERQGSPSQGLQRLPGRCGLRGGFQGGRISQGQTWCGCVGWGPRGVCNHTAGTFHTPSHCFFSQQK